MDNLLVRPLSVTTSPTVAPPARLWYKKKLCVDRIPIPGPYSTGARKDETMNIEITPNAVSWLKDHGGGAVVSRPAQAAG